MTEELYASQYSEIYHACKEMKIRYPIPRCAGLTVFRNITVFNITHKSKQQNAIADIVRSFTGIMITKKVEKEEEPGTQI